MEKDRGVRCKCSGVIHPHAIGYKDCLFGVDPEPDCINGFQPNDESRELIRNGGF